MKHVLFDFKTAKEPWFESVKDVYIKKINVFCLFEIVHLKSLNTDRDSKSDKIKHEEVILLKKISKDDYIILCDEKGSCFDSNEFAAKHMRALESGKKRVVFIIGGAFGVSDQIKNLAHLQVCLSPLVLNHLIAETVLLEQLFRSFTIQKRIPYHNS